MRWQLLVSGLAVVVASAGPTLAALPYANSLGDLCPGLPANCVVTAKWAVADGMTFDLAGRSLEVAPKARLVGDSGASFSFVNASQVTLQAGSVVSSMGRGQTAGSITFTSTGACSFSGTILANGVIFKKVGGDGGKVVASCAGISIDGGKIEAKGVMGSGDGFGFGGLVDLNAGAGALSMAKGTLVDAAGKGGDGGEITLTAQGMCTLNGTLRANAGVVHGTGGDGGTIDVLCAGGISWLAGSLKARGAGGKEFSGTGGLVSFDAGAGLFTLAKPVSVNVGARGEDAGDVDILSLGACTIEGKILAAASGVVAGIAGDGGGIDLGCNGITLAKSAVLRATGGVGPDGDGGSGGSVFLDAHTVGLDGVAGAKIDTRGGGGDGGAVDMVSTGPCTVAATVKADSNPRKGFVGLGGVISIVCGGDLLVAGKTQARSKLGGGVIALTGCGVTVATTGTVDTSGAQGGQNILTARNDLDVSGFVLAVSSNPLNPPGASTLTYRNAAVVNASRIKPAATPVQNGALPPC